MLWVLRSLDSFKYSRYTCNLNINKTFLALESYDYTRTSAVLPDFIDKHARTRTHTYTQRRPVISVCVCVCMRYKSICIICLIYASSRARSLPSVSLKCARIRQRRRRRSSNSAAQTGWQWEEQYIWLGFILISYDNTINFYRILCDVYLLGIQYYDAC